MIRLRDKFIGHDCSQISLMSAKRSDFALMGLRRDKYRYAAIRFIMLNFKYLLFREVA